MSILLYIIWAISGIAFNIISDSKKYDLTLFDIIFTILISLVIGPIPAVMFYLKTALDITIIKKRD